MLNLKRLNLLITKRCNLHCRMCDYRLRSYFVKEIKYEKIEELLCEAKSIGVNQLEISGGEPMMHKDIYKIIKYANFGLKN